MYRPSGEYTGVASNALFVVIAFGVPPLAGMTYRSLFPVSASFSVYFEKQISLPSGEMATSSAPSSVQMGESALPGVRSRASPPSAGTAKIWLYLPSTHSSHRRNGICVITRDLTGLSLRAFSAFSLHAMSAQSRKADAVTRIVLPSGDRRYASTPVGSLVICFASPPASD